MVLPESDPPVDVALLFDAERTALLRLLDGFRDDDWQRETPCPAWTVLDLTCHLLGGDLGLLARRRDQHAGPSPPAHASDSEFIDWLDELQAEWVSAARRLSPRLTIELLRWTQPRLVEVFAAEDLAAPTAHVSWAGPESVPVWLDQLRELSEYWIHRQQLLEAVDSPPDVAAEVLRPILLGLRLAYPFRLSKLDAPSGSTIRFSVGPPLNETWFLIADESQWTFGTRPGQHSLAEVNLTADHAWRLLTNNLREPIADLDITGDPTVVDVLRNTRAIIGHPQ